MPEVSDRLADLGFTATVTAPQSGSSPKIAVRIRTTIGWVYGKFNDGDAEAIEAWASKHQPG